VSRERKTRSVTPTAVAVIVGLAAGVALPGEVPRSVGAQESRPLPDPDAFRAAVRDRIRDDRELESQYTYLERTEELDITPLGKVQEGPTKLYEVYPSIDPGNTWKRLIAVDGEPLSDEKLAENDRKHHQDVRDRERASPEERRRREREDAEKQKEQEALVDELFEMFEATMVSRETVDGYPTILVTLDPKPDFRPTHDESKMMQKMRGRIWVHEFEHRIVRGEFEVLEDITYAWGLIGRVHAGSNGEFVQKKINDEVWLPVHARIVATGRSLLFRGFELDLVTEWSNYRKYRRSDEPVFTGQ
jgi:hypothetical protein